MYVCLYVCSGMYVDYLRPGHYECMYEWSVRVAERPSSLQLERVERRISAVRTHVLPLEQADPTQTPLLR
jgi:hypothetical protein